MIYETKEFEDGVPANMDMEYSLLGWILSNNRVMSEIGFLKVDHFHSAPHAEIFSAMEKLYITGNPVSVFTIQPLLKKDRLGYFDEAGGLKKYLVGAMTGSMINPFPVEQAKHIRELAERRSLVHICQNMAGDISVGGKSSADFAMELTGLVNDVIIDSPVSEFQNEQVIIEQILDDLKADIQPISTGMTKLDGAMGGGLFPGKSYGFAAKKKMGKTMLAGTISMNLNMAGVKHLFICGEMSPKEIHQRSISRSLGCYPSAFRTEFGKSIRFQSDIARLHSQAKNHILYRNAPGLTFDELRHVCTTAVDRHKVSGVILDYWQLVGGKVKNQSTAEHLDEVAQWIADFGRKHGVWMMMLAQINQEGNTRGGEGIRLAFDQVYHLRAPEDDPSRSGRYLEMMDTRYTGWTSIGTENSPGLQINEKGLFFEEV